MIIDCDHCEMQHTAACDDCVVSAIVAMQGPLELADEESEALEALADAGLVSPLRLVERLRDPDAAAG